MPARHPVRLPQPARPRARETPTCAATSARPPSARPAPPPSSASATTASPAAAAKAKAQVAVARSILVIIWHLLHDPRARFADLGPDHYQNKIDKNKNARNHIRQLQALGYTVTITPAA